MLVIRDARGANPRLIVVCNDSFTDAHLILGRQTLVQSEMGIMNPPERILISRWLDGRFRIEYEDGSVESGVEPTAIVVGRHRRYTRDVLDRLEPGTHELPGLGAARYAPGFPYPRRDAPPFIP